MNYEEDIRIDETALDVEWLRQASLMMKYSKHLAHLLHEKDLVKVDLDLVKARLDKSIRTKPSNYGIDKITETVVTNTIITQEDYLEAQAAYMQAEYEVNIAQAAVNAFNARKTALENLVRLFGQQYFAGPTIPHNLTKEWEERTRQSNANAKVGGMKRKGQ